MPALACSLRAHSIATGMSRALRPDARFLPVFDRARTTNRGIPDRACPPREVRAPLPQTHRAGSGRYRDPDTARVTPDPDRSPDPWRRALLPTGRVARD